MVHISYNTFSVTPQLQSWQSCHYYLETFIPNAFAKKGHAMSIYFDLEKAYDTTWKYGILKSYLSTFISNRKLDYGCIIYVNLISSCLIQLIIKDYDSHLEHSYLEFFYLDRHSMSLFGKSIGNKCFKTAKENVTLHANIKQDMCTTVSKGTYINSKVMCLQLYLWLGKKKYRF
jgi:hypothetical protein